MKNKIAFVAFSDNNYIDMSYSLYKSISSVYSEDEFDFYIGLDDSVDTCHFDHHNNVIVGKINKFIPNPTEIKITHITTTTMARLYMHKIFPSLLEDNVKNIIYIDSDAIVLKKIEDRMLKKNNYAIICDYLAKDFSDGIKWFRKVMKDESYISNNSKLLKNNNYFNAGIIFINNKEVMFDLFDYIIKNGDLNIDDQNLLNYFNTNKQVVVLNESKYNFMPFKSKPSKDISILHFAGEFKPWSSTWKTAKNEECFEYYDEISKKWYGIN